LIGNRGAAEILGRPLTPREAKECEFILSVERAYYSRKASKKWGEWAEKNKESNDLLIAVQRIVNG